MKRAKFHYRTRARRELSVKHFGVISFDQKLVEGKVIRFRGEKWFVDKVDHALGFVELSKQRILKIGYDCGFGHNHRFHWIASACNSFHRGMIRIGLMQQRVIGTAEGAAE